MIDYILGSSVFICRIFKDTTVVTAATMEWHNKIVQYTISGEWVVMSMCLWVFWQNNIHHLGLSENQGQHSTINTSAEATGQRTRPEMPRFDTIIV